MLTRPRTSSAGAPPPPETNPNCSLYHVVAEGDSCARLSVRYQVSLTELISESAHILSMHNITRVTKA